MRLLLIMEVVYSDIFIRDVLVIVVETKSIIKFTLLICTKDFFTSKAFKYL